MTISSVAPAALPATADSATSATGGWSGGLFACILGADSPGAGLLGSSIEEQGDLPASPSPDLAPVEVAPEDVAAPAPLEVLSAAQIMVAAQVVPVTPVLAAALALRAGAAAPATVTPAGPVATPAAETAGVSVGVPGSPSVPTSATSTPDITLPVSSTPAAAGPVVPGPVASAPVAAAPVAAAPVARAPGSPAPVSTEMVAVSPPPVDPASLQTPVAVPKQDAPARVASSTPVASPTEVQGTVAPAPSPAPAAPPGEVQVAPIHGASTAVAASRAAESTAPLQAPAPQHEVPTLTAPKPVDSTPSTEAGPAPADEVRQSPDAPVAADVPKGEGPSTAATTTPAPETAAPATVVPGSQAGAGEHRESGQQHPAPNQQVAETAPTSQTANAQPTAPVQPVADRQPTVAPGHVTGQVFPEIGRLVTRGDGTRRITLKLSPEALGDVRVTLTVRDGDVHIRMVGSELAQQALRSGAPELQRLLDLAGATTSQIVVGDQGASPDADPQHGPGDGRGPTDHRTAGTRDGDTSARDGSTRGPHPRLSPDPAAARGDVTRARPGVDVTM